jgi:hypothetical protein
MARVVRILLRSAKSSFVRADIFVASPSTRGEAFQPRDTQHRFFMIQVFTHLNFFVVLATALLGFLLGWLWYSPLLFARTWLTEMKFTEQTLKSLDDRAKAKIFLGSVAYTLVSTFALAMLISAYDITGAQNGAAMGAFLGAFIVSTRVLNHSLWDLRSWRMVAIVVGYEGTLFTMQGAILGAWQN